jgi:Xaa-Pro aminopeptidase
VTAGRRAALIAALPDGVDALLVTNLVNVRYLTGFTGSNAALMLPRDGEPVLATDGRYDEQAATEVPDAIRLITRTIGPDLVRRARDERLRRVAIERHHVTLTSYDALVEAVGGEIEFVDAGEAIERLRTVKDANELAAITRACAVTDRAFTGVLDRLRPGATERDVAWSLLTMMTELGAEAAAFDSIVAFGPNSAIPHHRPTDRALATGDLVKLDFGARVDGYHADMTRTVVCGRAADWQRDLHATVQEVQSRCCAASVVGAVPVELDQLARDLLRATDHDLVHGLGHGLGLEIHEQPFVVPGSAAGPLRENVTVTVEPGIYLPGRGGVRIEDTVRIDAGGAEPLTTSPRDLLEV